MYANPLDPDSAAGAAAPAEPDLAPGGAAAPTWMTGWRLTTLWLLVGASLLAFVGGPPVLRTQEARVLETAREILDHPGSATAWLLPELNGMSRLRKPPLTYWLSAAAFAVGGVSEGVGRVPTAVAGWLLVGLTFAAADRLLGRRAAFFSAAALATSYLFFKHARLAETDAPAALFVTAAVYALLRAAEAEPCLRALKGALGLHPGPVPGRGPAEPGAEPLGSLGEQEDFADASGARSERRGPLRAVAWHQAAAVAMGLAFNAKGLPGLFPLAFLAAFAGGSWHVAAWQGGGGDHRWDVVRRFLLSGAPLTLLVVGGWWYAYAAASHPAGVRQFARELREVGAGEGHGGSPLLYVPRALGATLPWSGLLVAGTVGAVARWRAHAGLRTALVWAVAILVPLLLTPNKQFHYLFPLMPPAAMLVGWAIDVGTGGRGRGDARDTGDARAGTAAQTAAGGWADRSVAAAGLAVRLTLAALMVAAVGAVPAGARVARGSIRAGDLLLALGLTGLAAAAWWAWRRGGPAGGVGAATVALAVALPVVAGAWYPTLTKAGVREVAAEILRVAPDGPFCFYGRNMDLPLAFHLRHESPIATDANRLTEQLWVRPDTLVIVTAADNEKSSRPPAEVAGLRLAPVKTIRADRHRFELYRAAGPAGAATASAVTPAAPGSSPATGPAAAQPAAAASGGGR